MKVIGSEVVKVDPTPITPDGTKLEPEERTAIEAYTTPVSINLADHATRPDAAIPSAGAIPGFVGNESSAGEMAQDVRTRCDLCAHWRHEDWTRHLGSIQDTPTGKRQIDALRGELLGRDARGISITPDDFAEVNRTIRDDFGICVAFTESEGMPVASPCYGGCPASDPRFKERGREGTRQATARYDTILRLAQGRN